MRIADCEVEIADGVRVSLEDALALSLDQQNHGTAFVVVRDGIGFRVPPEVIDAGEEPDAVDVSKP